MPNSEPSPLRPEAGSLSSFILYHLERGASRVTITKLASERQQHQDLSGLQGLISHYTATAKYGRRFNDFSPNTPLSRLRLPSLGSECSTIRVSFTATIADPGSGSPGTQREVGFTLDTAYGGTVGDIHQDAEDYVRRWIGENYDVSSRGLNRRKVNIVISRAECF